MRTLYQDDISVISGLVVLIAGSKLLMNLLNYRSPRGYFVRFTLQWEFIGLLYVRTKFPNGNWIDLLEVEKIDNVKVGLLEMSCLTDFRQLQLFCSYASVSS